MIAFGNRHVKLERLAAGELAAQLDAGPVTPPNLHLAQVCRLASILLEDDALREVNELVPAAPFLRVQSQPLDQRTAAPSEPNRERPQPHFDRYLTARERDRPCALLEPHGHYGKLPRIRSSLGCHPVKWRPMPRGGFTDPSRAVLRSLTRSGSGTAKLKSETEANDGSNDDSQR